MNNRIFTEQCRDSTHLFLKVLLGHLLSKTSHHLFIRRPNPSCSPPTALQHCQNISSRVSICSPRVLFSIRDLQFKTSFDWPCRRLLTSVEFTIAGSPSMLFVNKHSHEFNTRSVHKTTPKSPLKVQIEMMQQLLRWKQIAKDDSQPWGYFQLMLC